MASGILTTSLPTPPPYLAGTVNLPVLQGVNLLEQMQIQLAVNCPGTAIELHIQASPSNSRSVFVGATSNRNGHLSQTNYAYRLTPTGPARIYRSTYPGNSVPIGDLQLLSPGGGAVHVEIWT
jgi:hypothetical protein